MAEVVGVVIIGRNEGERLIRCLESIKDHGQAIYVDSGSTDNSVAEARARGVDVVVLPTPPKFTAARARNTGIDALASLIPDLTFVQMVDGDCEVQPGWMEKAKAALMAEPDLAGVFGRRRERFPDKSVYNALCDDEWNVPIGEAGAFGGDVMLRLDAIRAVGGYNDDMIAGEDPDLSMRLRKAGWRIRRLDAEMTLHDAAIMRFGQWWSRVRRAGHAFAELAAKHPDMRDPDWRKSCRRIVLWGAAWPAVIVFMLLVSAFFFPMLAILAVAVALLWPAKVMQIAFRQRRQFSTARLAAASGFFLMLGKFPEFMGLLRFRRNQAKGRSSTLIEYKRGSA